MSTNNFYYNNILLTNNDDNDDEYYYSDIVDEVKYILEKYYKDFNEDLNNEPEAEELRSYPSQLIGKIYFTNKWGVEIVLRSGYYSGINIDYTIFQNNEDYYTNTLYGEDCDNIPDYINKKLIALENRLRKICYFQELTKIATFSNGEALYELKK